MDKDTRDNATRTIAARLTDTDEDMFTLGADDAEPVMVAGAFYRSAARATEMVGVYVHKARAQGLSWQVIGDTLGMSRQAAQQRWG